MKQYSTLCLILLFVLFVFSPSCVRKSKYTEILRQHDSLQIVSSQRAEQLEMINSYLDTIASSIDSITHQEVLLLSRTNADGVKLSKKDIRKNLELLEALIDRQRTKIYELDSTLVVMQDSTSRLRSVISFLYQQLDEKDAEIQRMKIQMGQQTRKIIQLSTQVSTLQTDVSELTSMSMEQSQEIKMQSETIAMQDAMIYTAYYIVGTKKELKEKGVLSTAAFAGNKVDISSADMSVYTKVDIREFTSLELTGQKVKVLSQMPTGSYRIETIAPKKHRLVITDTRLFWNTSKVLVIQN